MPRPGPRPSTSREAIVQRALHMLERKDAEPLTFRALARELGVATGTLARYFKTIADLQDEVAVEVLSKFQPLETGSKTSLRDQLLRVGMDLLDLSHAYPNLLKVHGPASLAVALRYNHRNLSVMVAAGIDVARAMGILTMLSDLTNFWGNQARDPANAKISASDVGLVREQMAEFAPQMFALFATDRRTVHRQWLQFFIDGMLALPSAIPERAAPRRRVGSDPRTARKPVRQSGKGMP